MQIVQDGFFGKITPTTDAKTGRCFFQYFVGTLRSNEVLFDGAAGDELEALQTVKAHLSMLASATGHETVNAASAS